MVRLKENCCYDNFDDFQFQFHYGTIKRQQIQAHWGVNVRFQFHYGTIKSDTGLSDLRKYIKFQFHYGTIKRQKHKIHMLREENFNSTMVRLKETFAMTAINSSTFQFHYGTIKRPIAPC